MINQWVFAVSIEHLDFVNRTCSIQVYSQAYCSDIIPCEKKTKLIFLRYGNDMPQSQPVTESWVLDQNFWSMT